MATDAVLIRVTYQDRFLFVMLYFYRMTAVRLTEKEIHKILFGIHSLSAAQRQMVQDELRSLKSDGGMYRLEFEKLLHKLRKEMTISEIDRQNLEEAFGQFFQ